MDRELQLILNGFENLFKHHKNPIDLDKELVTSNDFDMPIGNVLKDEKLRELLLKLDKWLVDQKRI